jgi:DeoR/GlpR family transcriptional regulator of sugar metabolism
MLKGISKEPLNQLSKTQQVLQEYLEAYEKITVKQYAKLCNFSERRARRTLTEETLNGFLMSHDFNKDIFFSLA